MTEYSPDAVARMTPQQRKVLLLRLTQKKLAQATLRPLSFAQQRLWFLDQLEPASPLYNIPVALSIAGNLESSVLERSIQEIIARHEALRTTFTLLDEQPMQKIAPQVELHLLLHDLTMYPSAQQASEVQRLAQEEALRPFQLSTGPLIRATLLCKGPVQYVLLLTMHHIVADGWSAKILTEELAALYQAFAQGLPSPLPPLLIQYADFAIWQRDWLQASVLEEQKKYWHRQMQGAPTLLSLPSDFPRPAMQSFKGARMHFVIPETMNVQVKELSKQARITSFITVLSAFYVFLYRYSGQEDLVVGTPIANRTRTEIEPLIGFFINTLALRLKLSGKMSFREVIEQVRKICINAYNHQDLPFEQLIEMLQPERSLSYTPLFQVMFGLHEATFDEFHLPGLTFTPLSRDFYTSKFDLSLDIVDTPQGLRCLFEYSTDLFVKETVQRMSVHFQQTLAALLTVSDASIDTFPLLTAEEEQVLLVDWNQTHMPLPAITGVHQLFELQVARTPLAEAVVYQQERLTYSELNAQANQLARYLLTRGVGPEVCVGLYLERSLSQVVAILATLKAGGNYLPLDPAYPPERLTFMLADAQVTVLVTQQSLSARFIEQKLSLVILEECDESQTENVQLSVEPNQLAFMIYTSGSTGKPKGAMITHINLLNYALFFAQQYQLPSLIHAHLLMASFSFDVFIADMVRSLCNGATLIMCPYETVLVPEQLYALMLREKVDSAEFVPAVLKGLADYLEQTQQTLSFMHLLAAGADSWPVRDYEQVLHLCDPTTRILNVYGLTEATIDNAHFDRNEASGVTEGFVPIGRPIANTQLYILNQALQAVPPGVMGELYVGGRGVGRGYFRRPDLTAERFIPDPFSQTPGSRLYRTGDVVRYRVDGTIEFFGRSDQQVKIHGFRIELGEIEDTLARHPMIGEALVMAREDRPGEKKLVAYLTQGLQYELPTSLNTQAIKATWDHEQIVEWQVVFEDLYSPDRVVNMDELDAQIGWNSSFTDQRLPVEEVDEWVAGTVARFLAQKPSRVLETGCGSGLLLPRIAPTCSLYWGTDFSNAALDYIREQLKTLQLPQVSLLQRTADDFSAIPPATFDAMLMASVTQYFPNIDYLYRVIAQSIQHVTPGGFILIADIRNLLLLEAFHTSVQIFRAPDDFTREQLQIRIRQNIVQEKQLVVDPSFFSTLRRHFPRITGLNVSLRRGTYRNELTSYRYDVLLRLDGPEEQLSSAETQSLDWQQEQLTLHTVRELLTQRAPVTLLVKRIPNSRIWFDVLATRLLKDPQGPATAGTLRAILHTRNNEGVDPEDFWSLEQDLPYTLAITWSEQDTTGAYDVLFQRHNAQTQAQPTSVQPTALTESAKTRPQSWDIYANNPLRSKINRELLSQLRHYTQKHLPQYMLPAAFVLLESFPLTPNGKIDRRALPPPGRNRPELEERYVEPRTPIEERIAALWSEVLGLDRVGIFDNFFALGGHSLLATHLVFQISKAFQVDVPLRVLFTTPTVVGLTDAVNKLLLGESLHETVAQEPLDLKREALLAPEIGAAAKPHRQRGTAEVMLLTGATGFLGVHLLAELLQTTRADICCLVRAANLDAARNKIQQALQAYQLWQDDTLLSRIQPVLADLTRPFFGLSADQFAQLAQRVDSIYHCGAAVNFIYPYHLLKATNVLGTQEILRLASLYDVKQVHLVSTLSVFPKTGTGSHIFQEDDQLRDPSGLTNGYEQTKWVADRLALEARARGIPVALYRPGLIGGHSQTGMVNLKDMLWSQLKGCIQMQAAPTVDSKVDISPVDYICKAIVYLSMQPATATRTFHLFNRAPASWNTLVDLARAKGYRVAGISYSSWITVLQHITEQSQDNALTPFMSTLRKERSQSEPTQIDDHFTHEALAQAGIVSPTTAQLLPTYLAFLQRCGFLQQPVTDDSTRTA